jgi:Ca2+-dependent lipid-binding protein
MKEAMKDNKRARSGQVTMTIKRATNLLAADWGNSSDPYCAIEVLREGGSKVSKGRTSTIKNTLHPVWDHSITIGTDMTTSAIKLLLKDEDLGSADDLLGTCYLPMEFLIKFKTQTVRVAACLTPTTEWTSVAICADLNACRRRSCST